MIKYILPLGLVTAFFSGCISVTKELPPFSTYTLLVNERDVKHIKNIKKSIAIAEPKSINSVNNILITYANEKSRSESYALSRWSDKPTKILHQIMINYLNETKNYNYVHGNRLNLPSDIKLLSELDSFTQYLEADSAFIKFSIRVFVVENKKLETKSFSYTQQCDNQSAKSSVKALNLAVNKFLQELDIWIVNR